MRSSRIKWLFMLAWLVAAANAHSFPANANAADPQCANACIKVISIRPAPAPVRKYLPDQISVEIKNLCTLGLQVDITGTDGRDDDAFYHPNQTRVQQVKGPNYTSIRVHACMQPGVGEGSGKVD